MTPLNNLIQNVQEAANGVEIAYARAKRNAGALLHATEGEAARKEINSLGADDSLGPVISSEVSALATAVEALKQACPTPVTEVAVVEETPAETVIS